MTIINKAAIEIALKLAQNKLRTYENNKLNEGYIEAKAAIDCFNYVLENCKEVYVIDGPNQIEIKMP